MQTTPAGPGNGLHDDVRAEGADGGGKAQDVAGQAQDVAEQAKSKGRQMLEERSTQVGRQVSSQAGDLRSVGEQLRNQGKDAPARIADQAADRVERLGGYLSEADADRLLDDVEDLARKNPWTVALGGLALGFAASRFLKASSQQRHQRRGDARVGSRPYDGNARSVPATPPAAPAVTAAPVAAPPAGV